MEADQQSSVKQAIKLALCIHRNNAPASVRGVLAGTHRLPLTEEFFHTPACLQDRDTCETDPQWLQLLPYIVIRERASGKVFRYFRGKGGTEDRLHGRISIGVGGHVEHMPEAGTNLFDHLKADAKRECLEEIGVVPDSIEFVSLVYNPHDVNEVHLGILGVATIDSVAELEAGVIEHGEFVDHVSLLAHDVYGRLEPWSHAAVWYLSSLTDPEAVPA